MSSDGIDGIIIIAIGVIIFCWGDPDIADIMIYHMAKD